MFDYLQQNMMWATLAVVSGGMLLWPMLRGGRNGISPTEATLLINREDAVVVDVRETGEWSSGHIPEARHVALAQLEKHLSELEKFKHRPLIVCCATGSRSQGAVGVLQHAGFERVFNLNGGIAAWAEANLPLTGK